MVEWGKSHYARVILATFSFVTMAIAVAGFMRPNFIYLG